VSEGISRIFGLALTDSTEEELGLLCLEVAEEVTGSKFSFMGEIKPTTGKFDSIAISKRSWAAFAMDDPAFLRFQTPVGFEIHWPGQP
jgi:two-component system, chemotaxis family, CheB/CheR fusion protein